MKKVACVGILVADVIVEPVNKYPDKGLLERVKYYQAEKMQNGEYTDEMYQQFIDKMYAVGMQEYMDGAQAQLDAWLAANGK